VVSIVRDITAERETTQALERTRRLLEEGERIAHLGVWEYIVATQETVWSAEECRIYGLEPGAPSPDYWAMLRDCIHPDDAEGLDRLFQEALRREKPFEMEHRIVRPDGSVRIVRDRAHPYHSETGLVKYIGTTLDITELRTVEHQSRESESILRLATESAQIGVWFWNLKTNLLNLVATVRKHLALPDGAQPSYEHFVAVLHPEDRDRIEQAVRASLTERHDFVTEYRVMQPDGSFRWIEGLGRGEWENGGQATGMRGVTLDITERRRLETEAGSEAQVAPAFHRACPGAAGHVRQDMRYLAHGGAGCWITA
jgi:PAS domain-containing protein